LLFGEFIANLRAFSDATARRKPGRTNSLPPSEADSSESPGNYGTITSQHTGGASTPKRRPSGPHRLGSVTSTALAFDKVKMKGVKGAQRSEAMQAVIQNLEAMGNTVEIVNTDDPSDNGQNGHEASADGNGEGGNDAAAGGKGADADRISGSHVEVTVEHPNGETEDLVVTMDEDENAPLLGGKQLASSPRHM
jgi:hypothetical protein